MPNFYQYAACYALDAASAIQPMMRHAHRKPKAASRHHLNKSEGFDMLFGACSCLPAALSMSRRGLLCAGGAGFVTALIGTLASSSRIVRAQVLASKPP
jgi:hypothetical protein